MNDMPMRHEVEQKFYPDGVDRVPQCIADYSIPTLDQVIQKFGNKMSGQLVHLLENQMVLEKLAWAETDNSDDSLGHAQESEPPTVCNEFQAARLFLSHFGFLSMDDDPSNENTEAVPSIPMLTVLDTKKPGFLNELQALDKLSPRTNDTLHAFYVKVGQTTANEIIDNVSDDNVATLNKHFWNVLMNLGWPVDIEEHSGWTGFVKNSWKIHSNDGSNAKKEPAVWNTTDNLKFNGEKRVLYWADVSSEIAFVVPTKWNKSDDVADGSCLSLISSSSNEGEKSTWSDRSVSLHQAPSTNKMPLVQKPRTLSLELDKSKSHSTSAIGSADPIPPSRRRTCAMKPSLLTQTGAKILLVWLESFEDHLTFPTGKYFIYILCSVRFRDTHFSHDF